MDGWVDEWMDRQTDGCVVELLQGQTSGLVKLFGNCES